MRAIFGSIRTVRGVALTAAILCTVGCAGSHRECDTRPVAECPVCKCNADLGCLIVRVDDSTPRSEFGGRTYFFCSEECKGAFDKAPRSFAK